LSPVPRPGRGGQVGQLFAGDTDARLAVENGDGGREGAPVADRGLHPPSDLQVVWPVEAVGDEGGFQGDDGPPGLDGMGDRRINAEGMHG